MSKAGSVFLESFFGEEEFKIRILYTNEVIKRHNNSKEEYMLKLK